MGTVDLVRNALSGLDSLRREALWRCRFRRWYTYYGQVDLCAPLAEVQPTIDVEVQFASADDLREIESYLEPHATDWLKRRGCDNNICFVAKSKGEIAAATMANLDVVHWWWSPNATEPLPPDTAFLHAGFVYPQFRGCKIFQYLNRKVYAHLRGRGMRYACNLTAPNNAASLVAARRLGARFQEVRFVTLPWLKPIMVSPRPLMGDGEAGGPAPTARRLPYYQLPWKSAPSGPTAVDWVKIEFEARRGKRPRPATVGRSRLER